uniref:Uncharacterized protein n=1 Tax=Oreochromis aureus TaxID=47969 RepID=A0A668VDM6_OREAU
MRPHLSTSISLACPPASPLARGVSPSFLCNTQWEMSETGAVEVLPLEVDVLLICFQWRPPPSPGSLAAEL